MGQPLRVLVVEDSERDAELVVRELRRSGYDVSHGRVQTRDELRAALQGGAWDAVVSDYGLPAFDAEGALAMVLEAGLDVPFIIVSGSIGEEQAVAALKAGAHDFFLKDRLARLGTALARELREAAVRRERRAALAELRASEERLRQAVKARDDFLVIASHELNTPLTPLTIHVQSALSQVRSWQAPPSAEAARRLEAKLDQADKAVERLAALVRTLLDVTRITADRFKMSRAPLDLALVARDLVERWRDAFSKSGMPLSLDAADAVLGSWDRTAVETILNNLLSNALKFGGSAPVQVAVVRRGERARVVVADRGLGIPAEDRARIFERFERAVPDRHFGGLGVGLWVVRQIVDAMGGSIHVESEEGAGSTFVVELPLTAPAP